MKKVLLSILIISGCRSIDIPANAIQVKMCVNDGGKYLACKAVYKVDNSFIDRHGRKLNNDKIYSLNKLK